jgi:hypothetical protein
VHSASHQPSLAYRSFPSILRNQLPHAGLAQAFAAPMSNLMVDSANPILDASIHMKVTNKIVTYSHRGKTMITIPYQ